METLKSILLFEHFIAPSVFIVFYYLGALGVPIFMIAMWRTQWGKLGASLFGQALAQLKLKHRWLFILMLFMSFLLLELFWRLFFEMLIGYFDMHDALMKMSATS